MRNFPRHAFILTLTIALFSAITVLVWGIYQKSRLDEESRQLAIDVIQAVFSSASAAPLINRAHPDLLGNSREGALQIYVSSIHERIGELQSINSIDGAAQMALNPFTLDGTMAHYTISLQFSQGQAQANIELKRLNGDWLIREMVLIAALLND